jgi:hypothetical protein
MENMPSINQYDSNENDILNSIEKSIIYSMTTMYAKPKLEILIMVKLNLLIFIH